VRSCASAGVSWWIELSILHPPQKECLPENKAIVFLQIFYGGWRIEIRLSQRTHREGRPAYCNSIYASFHDPDAAIKIKAFGRERTKLSTADFNTAHIYEHYGTIAPHMRIKGLLPDLANRASIENVTGTVVGKCEG